MDSVKDSLLSGCDLGLPHWNLQEIRDWEQKEAKVSFPGIATKSAASGWSCTSPDSHRSCHAALSIPGPGSTALPVQDQSNHPTSYITSLSLPVSTDFV